jgi:P-type Ca2+ transporter type 2C
MIINLIMIGGQVLIVFVGGEAFRIVRLDGKEWGLSIGLGAISLPWGAVMRLVPDSWMGAIMPRFIRKRWIPEPENSQPEAEQKSDDESFRKPLPLRTLTMIRGKRVRTHVHRGFREYMHDQKLKVKENMHKKQ